MLNRKVPYFDITGQSQQQKVRARFEMPPWNQVWTRWFSSNLTGYLVKLKRQLVVMAICQTLSRISVFGLCERFSIVWKSSFMAWNFK